MAFFKNLRLVTQLVSTFILVALISGGVGLVSYQSIHRIDAADTWLYEKCTVPLGQLSAIVGNFNLIRVDVYRCANARDKNQARQYMQEVDRLTREVAANVQGYSRTLIDAGDEQNYLRMKADLEAYDRANDKVLELKLAGRDREAQDLAEGELQQQGMAISSFLKQVVEYNERFARQTAERNQATAASADRQIGITIALGVLFSITLGVAVTRLIRRQLGGDPAFAAEVVKRISMGDLGTRFEVQAGEEQSLLGNIKFLGENLERLASQADAVGQGDFTGHVQPLSEQDRLGHAIANMNAMLAANRSADQRRNWLKDGSNQLALALTGDFTLQQLADTAIALIGRTLDAGRGVFYVHRPAEGALDLLGSYMYSERAALGGRYREGEGAIGQVARERKPIILVPAGAEAAPILTGTTCAPPLCTYTYPLLHEGGLLGVLELASAARFDELKLDYLRGAAEVVAAALFVAEQRENIRALLTATESAERQARATSEHLQEVNARMEEQQQQLQQQTEELQQANAQMEEQQQQLQQQTEELQQSNAQMEEQQLQLQQNNLELLASRAELDGKARLLEQSSHYKSEFLANMSHELRTPLNSIILLSKLMADNREGRLEGQEVKRAEVIHRSGKDLLNLINDVLDLSKIEAGRMDLCPQELSSAALVEEYRDSFGSLAQERGLEFVIDDRIRGPFTSDPDKLGQILRNLLSNAFKFTKEGRVSLLLERRPRDPLPLYLAVLDTGIGIPEEKQGAIFEAFRQADGSTSREYGGTGLGLTISLRLAQLLGGTLEVRSAPERGSEFALRLPERPGVAQPNPQPAHPARATTAGLPADDRNQLEAGDPVILLIDDDPLFCAAILEINRRLGHKTLLAGTGGDGLALARSHRPAGILLDLGLPDMNGADVLHELKSTRELASIPVYVVSARDKDAALAGQGIVGYLQKPVDERQIEQAEATLLAGAAREVLGGILVVSRGGLGADEVTRLGAELGIGPERIRQTDPGQPLQALLENQPWRLAVIDLAGLSVAEGLEAAEAIRKARPAAALLFFGAPSLGDQDEASLRRYSDSIIVKAPLAAQRLQDDLRRFLSQAPRADAPPAWVPPGQEPPLAGRSILVVDDDPRNLFVITAALEQGGARVSTAINGRRALERLAEPGIDLVFMDIMMPELDGYETIRLIRAQPELARLPVVALTAKAMLQDRQKALAAGADDFLAKPVDYQELLDMAGRWCSLRK